MDDQLFQQLVSSVKEMKAVERGKQEPTRRSRMEPSHVTRVRQRLQLSQARFAEMMGISLRTLQNWEQGHRHPTGAAQVLLEVADRHPEALLETVAARA